MQNDDCGGLMLVCDEEKKRKEKARRLTGICTLVPSLGRKSVKMNSSSFK